MKREIYKRAIVFLAIVFSLSACAPAVAVQQSRLIASKDQRTVSARVVQEDVVVHLASGYERRIAAQSRWRITGTLPQGHVLKPIGTVFTIEGRQIHEAWLVVADDKLVVFYLPGESNFSPLVKPLSIKLGNLE